MRKRCGCVGLLALGIGASGCAGTARRGEGLLAPSPKTWASAPAPPQRQVSLPPERDDVTVDAASPTGLSRFFPGLRRNSVEAPRVAELPRPSRLSFARRPRATQVYTTDSRAGLARGMTDAVALPVALHLPTERMADRAVTPTTAQAVDAGPAPRPSTPDPEKPEILSPAPADRPEPGGTPPRAGQAPTDPPPAPSIAETPVGEKAPVAETREATTRPGPPPAPPAARPGPRPTVANPMPGRPATDPRERPRMRSMMAPSTQMGPSDAGTPAVPTGQAIPFPTGPASCSGSPGPAPRTPFLLRVASKLGGKPHVHPTSAWTIPPSLPTPRASPSPQVDASPRSCSAEATPSRDCRHCCLRELFRKLCKLGHASGARGASTR